MAHGIQAKAPQGSQILRHGRSAWFLDLARHLGKIEEETWESFKFREIEFSIWAAEGAEQGDVENPIDFHKCVGVNQDQMLAQKQKMLSMPSQVFTQNVSHSISSILKLSLRATHPLG